jgi:hypothetical protein
MKPSFMVWNLPFVVSCQHSKKLWIWELLTFQIFELGMFSLSELGMEVTITSIFHASLTSPCPALLTLLSPY